MKKPQVDVGDIITYNKHTLEVCQAKDNACTGCIGLTRQASCKKLPYCTGNIYFRKLNNFEIRRINKKKKNEK